MIHKSKPVTYSIICYIIAMLVVCVIRFSGNFKSGPCTPNLDLISFFLAVLISASMVVITLIRLIISRSNANLWLLLVNITGFCSWFLLGMIL